MEGDACRITDSANERGNFGASILREFDDHPGECIIDKALAFGKRGLIIGGLYGGIYGALFNPPPNVNGFIYSLRHVGAAGLVTGTAGLVLGAGVPIAQAIRKKDDPIAWGLAGFASGSMFGLRSGRFGLAMQCGFMLAIAMTATKAAEAYREPYLDYFKHLRQPPKLYKLIDENGNITTGREY